jgi:hypothetical protein
MQDPEVFANATPVASDVRQALRFLARKGAFAVPHQAAGADPASFAIHVEGDGVVLAFVPAVMVAQARSRGWVECDQQHRLRLSPAGLKALRKVLNDPTAVGIGTRKKSGRSAKRGKAAAVKASAHGLQEPPLSWLRRRKDKDGQPLITDAQFRAGERLAADYRRAHLSRRITSDWSGVAASRQSRRGSPDAGVELSDAAVAARERFRGALAVVGSELAGILIDVCCLETGLEAAERAEGWPQRAAKVVLQLALTSLARHYGLIAPERSPFARLRHWGDEDYRPTMDAWR